MGLASLALDSDTFCELVYGVLLFNAISGLYFLALGPFPAAGEAFACTLPSHAGGGYEPTALVRSTARG